MTTININNDDDLIKLDKEVNSIISKFKHSSGIIAVDGAMQSGKSTIIVPRLIKLLNAKKLDLDKLIKIDSKIIYKNKFPKIKSKWIIADGILNRKILRHFKNKANINIYVKKMVAYGWVERDWLDEDMVRDYGLNKDFLNHNVDKQIYIYHKANKPLLKADIIIELAEEFITKDFK